MSSIRVTKMKPLLPPSTTGFTLVEMLIVIAIIMVLCSLLLPSLRSAFGNAKIHSCSNNLRLIGISLTNYADDFYGLYPVGYDEASGSAPKLYASTSECHTEFLYYAKEYAQAPHMVHTKTWLPVEHGFFVCPGKPDIPIDRKTDVDDISYLCGQIFPNWYLLGKGRGGRAAADSYVVSASVSSNAKVVYGVPGIQENPPFQFIYPRRAKSPSVWPIFFDEALPVCPTNATYTYRNNHDINMASSINTVYLDNSVRNQPVKYDWTGNYRGLWYTIGNSVPTSAPYWYLPYLRCQQFSY